MGCRAKQAVLFGRVMEYPFVSRWTATSCAVCALCCLCFWFFLVYKYPAFNKQVREAKITFSQEWEILGNASEMNEEQL